MSIAIGNDRYMALYRGLPVTPIGRAEAVTDAAAHGLVATASGPWPMSASRQSAYIAKAAAQRFSLID